MCNDQKMLKEKLKKNSKKAKYEMGNFYEQWFTPHCPFQANRE